MSAPDLETLMKVETAYEDAAKVFLSSAVGITVFTSGEASDFVSPRLEIFLALGSALEPPSDPLPNLSKGEYSKYSANFSIQVITDPTIGQTRLDHISYIAKTRVALLRSSSNWNATNLPYYDTKYLRPLGTTWQVMGDLLTTELSYQIELAIREDAWTV
jgi:hypothetical protein|tara:strand:- start:5189 stop:5668 length:480 start_codon:yes stop_codon:yes gene_type:complete